MAYLTYAEFVAKFDGTAMDERLFESLAMVSSDIIDAIVTCPITPDVNADEVAKATAYQILYLQAQGGLDAINGFASSQTAVTEKLDDYSITEAQTEQAASNQLSLNGIPVSPLAVTILRKLGLMSRWVYSGRRRC